MQHTHARPPPPATATARSTGWLTHWGEPMANTSLSDFVSALTDILAYDGGYGSVNLYMAHGA